MTVILTAFAFRHDKMFQLKKALFLLEEMESRDYNLRTRGDVVIELPLFLNLFQWMSLGNIKVF